MLCVISLVIAAQGKPFQSQIDILIGIFTSSITTKKIHQKKREMFEKNVVYLFIYIFLNDIKDVKEGSKVSEIMCYKLKS